MPRGLTRQRFVSEEVKRIFDRKSPKLAATTVEIFKCNAHWGEVG